MKMRTFAWITLGVVLVAGNTALVLFLDRAPRPAPPGVGAGPAAPPPRETRVATRALPPGETPPPPQGFSLRVVVVDRSGAPIPGARVRGVGQGRLHIELAAAVTGADGSCELPFPRRTTGMLIAEAEGFGAETSLVLPPEVRIVLSPEGVLRGKVVEAGTGGPVPGASIRDLFEDPFRPHRAVSAEDGTFVLRGVFLPPKGGTGLRLRVSAAGFVPETVETGVDTGLANTVEVRLRRGGTVRGRVVFAGTDRSAADGTISWGPGALGYECSVPLGADGRFTLSGLPGNVRDFRVETEGRVYRARGQNPVLDPVTGEQVGEIEVPLPPNSPSGLEFKGVVRDGEGNPVEGARVIVDFEALRRFPQAQRFGADSFCVEATTDAEGRYRVVQEHRGNEILVLHPGYAPTHFVLPPRSYDHVFDLVLRRGVKVAVTVKDTAGRPAAWAKVYTYMRHSDPALAHLQFADVLGSLRENPMTDDGGSAILEPLGVGTWYLCARSADGREGTRVVLDVPANAGNLAVNLDLLTLPSIAGRIVDAHGGSVSGMQVGILGEDGINGFRRADAGPDGRFRFDGVILPPESEGALGAVVHVTTSRKVVGADEHNAVPVIFDRETDIVLQDD